MRFSSTSNRSQFFLLTMVIQSPRSGNLWPDVRQVDITRRMRINSKSRDRFVTNFQVLIDVFLLFHAVSLRFGTRFYHLLNKFNKMCCMYLLCVFELRLKIHQRIFEASFHYLLLLFVYNCVIKLFTYYTRYLYS